VSTEHRYWFPAKRYGWGWGMPTCRQGWAVFGAFIVLLAVGSFIFLLSGELGSFLAYVAVLCGLLVVVCWLKGEPPRWRWGG
jgi:hypothetical protein